jgi:hypothetical protein
MPYMAQQWLTTTVRDAYRARSDAGAAADEAARVRAWLGALPLDPTAVAALVEPIAALEDGLRQAAAGPPPTDPRPGT